MADVKKAEVKIYHGIRAILLRGTRDERATQHGQLIASLTPAERKGLALEPLAKKNQFLISEAAKKIKVAGTLLSTFYEAFVLERMLNLAPEYKSRLKPFAKASKLTERTLWLALFQPDLLMMLAALANDKIRAKLLPGMPGCSSGIYHLDGTLLFLRNLDYPAAAHWEKFATVFYHEPSELHLQPYVSIASLGIHTPGLTGFNQAGIAFSLHAQFSKNVRRKGTPIFFLGEDILEQASTLDQAIELCRRFKPIGNWTLNLASFKENKSASVELADGTLHVRMQSAGDRSFVAQSNGFQCEAFQKNELYFSGAFFEDVRARKQALDESHPQTEIEAMNALANHMDATTGEKRVFGNTVSVVTTIQSVVIDSGARALYVSARDETPTGLGPYVKFPFRWQDLEILAETASPTPVHSPDFLAALHAYSQAYVAWQVVTDEMIAKRHQRSELTLAHLIQASEILPNDPHLSMQRGYFELMHGEAKTALTCFESALKFKMSAHLTSVAIYFKATCLDLLGSRTDAVRHYGEVLSRPDLDEKLRKKAQNRLEKPFQRAYCQKIEPDLQFVEPLQYR